MLHALIASFCNPSLLHPAANHNLGVLAVLDNKVDLALTFFKTAIKANPKIERYWFSYIEQFIKQQKFEEAKRVIAKIKNRGIATEKITTLEKQLAPRSKVQAELPLSRKS